MSRGVLLAVALGLALAGWLWRAPAAPPENEAQAPGTARARTAARAPQGTADSGATLAVIERQLRALQDQLAREAAERQQLAARLDALAARFGDPGAMPATADGAASVDGDSAMAVEATGGAAPEPDLDPGVSPFERALIAAGVDAAVAADIRQRQDEVTLAEMYLRDQAMREQWIDTPRFVDAMAALEAQRVSLRAEIGDGAYDRYLAARGEPNRVRVDDVMTASPAAAAGLQIGDIVLRYGEVRIFQPGDLVSETRAGTAGEPVRVEVLRAGRRLTVDVPRGPLGLRIAGTLDAPDEG